MKRIVIPMIVASAALTTLPLAAQAARRTPVNQRQERIEQRIDQGVRTGELNRREAARLRQRLFALNRLEDQYLRSGHGLSYRERADLDRRFERLSTQVRVQKHDRQGR
jgi:hypothetical protein